METAENRKWFTHRSHSLHLLMLPLLHSVRRFVHTHCRVENVKCLSGTSMVLLEQIKTIDKRRVKKYMGRLDKEQMRRVDDCIEISLGLQIPECVEAPYQHSRLLPEQPQ